MSKHWSIDVEWERLDTGSPEEQAGFAALGIHADGICLTFGYDRLLQGTRCAPHLSAYHFAEWLAWNWWRLRWESRRQSSEWELSHSMASIGGGYIWPNIRIVSDGKNVSLECKPTAERIRTAYRYINDRVSVIPATDFEVEIDLFIEAVLQRLQIRQVSHSNLHDLWQTVMQERQDPALSRQRKLEALLGEDPGEMDEDWLQSFARNAEVTGQAALEEIAANRMPGKALPDIQYLLEQGREQGAVTDPRNRVALPTPFRHDTKMAAWRVGTMVAQQLRDYVDIDPNTAIPDDRLIDMYGTQRDIFDRPKSDQVIDLSFAVSGPDQHHRTVLRSRWDTGRRFELARLLGDSLIYDTEDPMRPATRTYTYRQRVQRAFAAEFLSPFQVVNDMLDGDYSEESQEDVARHFRVSSWTIRTLLVNHDKVNRDEVDCEERLIA